MDRGSRWHKTCGLEKVLHSYKEQKKLVLLSEW